MNIDDLFLNEIDAYFGAGCFDAPCLMQPIVDAKLLWFNSLAAEGLPSLRALKLNPTNYPDYVLRACAYRVLDSSFDAKATVFPQNTVAYADRYGGTGIGTNGGSGRAVILNGFHVKGVGRTSLIGADSSPAHASGGAYLEEAVREVIFTEICALEYPYGAIPILAIIDTGEDVIWDTSLGPKRERKVLVVRPCMLRPAHVERALLHISDHRWCGSLDSNRVAARANALIADVKLDGVKTTLVEWAEAWSNQLAYGFVHKFTHAAHSTSNVSFSGALLDFGACTTVSSWARFLILQDGSCFGSELPIVMRALRSIIENFFFNVDILLFSSEEIGQIGNRIRRSYEIRLIVETLRCCGLTQKQIEDLLSSYAHEAVFHAVCSSFERSQVEFYELSTLEPQSPNRFSFADIFEEDFPSNLEDLRKMLLSRLDTNLLEIAKVRSKAIGRLRMQLYRESLRDRIYVAVETNTSVHDVWKSSISEFIDMEVAAGRRDFGKIPDYAVPFGFVVGQSIRATIFRGHGENALFVLVQAITDSLWQSLVPESNFRGEDAENRILACVDTGLSFVTLRGAQTVRISCRVAYVHEDVILSSSDVLHVAADQWDVSPQK